MGCSSKAALEVVLCKERLVRELYESEVLWLVYQTQSRALGRKMVTQELQVGLRVCVCVCACVFVRMCMCLRRCVFVVCSSIS